MTTLGIFVFALCAFVFGCALEREYLSKSRARRAGKAVRR